MISASSVLTATLALAAFGWLGTSPGAGAGAGERAASRAGSEAGGFEAGAHTKAQQVDSLAWMAGCWEADSPRSRTREHWSKPAGGAMLGVNFSVRKEAGGDVAGGYEFLRIHSVDGRVTYTALPSGQALTDFHLTSLGSSEVTFANPNHDFPQRISYRRQGADSLLARVEGVRNGSMSGFGIAFVRVPCP